MQLLATALLHKGPDYMSDEELRDHYLRRVNARPELVEQLDFQLIQSGRLPSLRETQELLCRWDNLKQHGHVARSVANRPQHSRGHAHFAELAENRNEREPYPPGDVEQAMALHAEGLDKLPVHEIWADQDSASDEDHVEAFYVSAENAYEFLQDPEDPYDIEDVF